MVVKYFKCTIQAEVSPFPLFCRVYVRFSITKLCKYDIFNYLQLPLKNNLQLKLKFVTVIHVTFMR